MALSAFGDRAAPPTPADLERVLGDAAAVWRELVAHVSESCPQVDEQWSFASARYGWSMRLRRRDRVILYMIPQDNCFLAGVVLGEKAVGNALEAGLPQHVLALIDDAPRYAEGRGIRFAVSTRADLDAAQRLVALKLAR